MAYSHGTNKNGKIHMAGFERGNESNPHDEWYTTYCGMEYTDSDLTDVEEIVTCKNCLRVINKYKQP